MASRSYDRVDFYRRNRDYSRLLEGDGTLEEEYVEEADNNSRKYRKSAPDEDPQATRERQEFIQRRQKLKELERVKLTQKFTGVYGRKTDLSKHENGNQNSRYAGNISENDKKRKLPYDNYGSFFGPSQPVISRRVIEETRSRVEKADVEARVEKARVAARVEKARVAAKVSKEAPERKKSSTSSTNIKIECKKKPVVVNEAIKKAQQLKAARDYSFLLSEDAEIPASERGQTSQNRNVASTRPNNGQLKPLIAKNSTAVKKPTLSSKPVSHAKEVKSIGSSSRQMPAKVDSQKVSVDSKKLLTKIVSGGQSVRDNVSIRQNGSNAKMPVNACTDKKRLPATSGSKVIKAEHQRSSVKAEQQSSVMHRTSVQKAPPLKTPTQRPHTEQRKPAKSMPSKPVTKLLPKPAPTPKVVPKPAPTPAPKAVPKPTSKPVPKMAPKSQSRPPTRDLHHERPNKRPRVYDSDEDLDEGTNFRSLIRQMFRYDPSKYKDIDEDDSDMEVGFSRIQAEERRSARIAREEDERELALIEAEEMEERAKAKKRKLKQGQR